MKKKNNSPVSLIVALLVPVSLILALLLGCAKQEGASVNAPDSQAAKAVEEEYIPGIYEVLDLAPEQEEKIHDIIMAHKEAWKGHDCKGEHKHDGKRCPKKKKAMWKARKDALHDKILAVLNPTQRAKAIAMKEQLEKGEIPEELIDLKIKRLTGKLDLTEDQQAKLKVLFTETGKKLWAAKQDCDKKRKCRQEIRKILKDSETTMLSYLTPEQQETYATMQKARKERMKDRRKRMRRHGHKMGLEFLTKTLSLTDDQQKQVKKILHDSRQDMKKLKKEDLSREDWIRHRKETDQAIMAILTPEQQAKYKELIKKRMERWKHHHKDGECLAEK